MNETSQNIWNVFETATRAGKEAIALLGLIEENLTGLTSKDVGNVKEIKTLDTDDETDASGWIFINETRTYGIVPLGKKKSYYALGIQLVLFDHEGSITSNQAVLNVCLQYDKSGNAFGSENWFSANPENTWDGYDVKKNNYTISNLGDSELQSNEDEIIFAIPLGALGSPQDVELKVIKPIKALLKFLDPNHENVVQVFEDARDIICLKGVNFPKEESDAVK